MKNFLILLLISFTLAASELGNFVTIINSKNEKHKFYVENAITDKEQRTGLMYRKDLKTNHGMLFHYVPPREVSMWMKNTYIALDIIFIDNNNIITKIYENTEPLSLKPLDSINEVKYVLEINSGLAKKLNIKINDKISID